MLKDWNNQQGSLPLSLLVALLAIVSVVAINNTVPLKDNLMSVLFPKGNISAQTANFTEYVSTFRLQNEKTEMEKFLNPFGETWESKQASNPAIPVMLAGAFDRTKSASYGLTDRAASFNRLLPSYYPNSYPQPGVNYYLDLTEGYKNLLRNANTPYTFYNQGGGLFSNRPRYSMPSSNIVIRELDKINPNLKHNSYYVINFVEETDLAGYDNLKEEWYVHRKGTDPTKPENRVKAAGGQDILDVTKPEFQQHMATNVAKAMQDNQLDWLLVDGAGDADRRPRLLNNEDPAAVYPDHFNPQAFFSGTLQTLGALKAKLNPLGKEVIFNPITPDVMDDNRVAQVRQYLEVTDGAYWENPFRTGTRDAFASQYGVDYYFTQLQKFFDLANSMNKVLVVESDTVNDYTQNPANVCSPMFLCEYGKILAEKGYTETLRYEQTIARRHLALYLLFQTDPQKNIYSHYTLAEPLSYETSEATFADYDLRIGKSTEKMVKIADNIYKRQFENGLVFINYSKQPYTVGVNYLTCDDYYQSVCQKPHYMTAEGIPVTSFTLEPETGMIFVTDSVMKPYNPSFETVWNWKPNQFNWGKIDYSKARTGRNSYMIPPNTPDSPGLTQIFNFKPYTIYKWSGYVKTENSNKTSLTVAFTPPGTTTTAKTVPVSSGVYIYDNLIPTGTTDWKLVEINFTTGAQGGSGNFYVVAEALNSGTVWFDDVTLIEQGAATPTVSFSDKDTSSYCLTTTQPRIHVQWNPTTGAKFYNLYVTNPNGTKTVAYQGDGIAINYDTAQSGQSYSFLLEAKTDWNGTVIGTATKTITAVTCQSTTPKPNIIAADTSSYCVGSTPTNHIQWSSYPNTAIYKIWRETAMPGSGTKVGETSGIAMNDIKAVSGTEYTYIIEATMSNGTSVVGDPYKLKTVTCATPTPSPTPVPVTKVDVKKMERLAKPEYLETFFTSKANEIAFLENKNGWSKAVPVFKAPAAGSANAVMAKRLYFTDAANKAQIRTWAIDPLDIKSFTDNKFSQTADSDFYAYPSPKPNTIGITRMKKYLQSYNKTIYTFARPDEINNLTAKGWVTDKSNVFYVFPL